MSQFVAGNAEHLTADELHQRAWAVCASQAEDARDTAIARYRDAIGTAHCTTFASDIVTASAAGRVDTIFVNDDRPIWGRVDDQGLVLIDDDRRPRGEDLVNRSVAHTLLHGGEAVGQVDLGVHAMAALLRY
jgi:hypothetical protein